MVGPLVKARRGSESPTGEFGEKQRRRFDVIGMRKGNRMQKNNGAAACASCRHQRKKCTEKCVLAPFFPVAKSQEFHAVHKIFGVSNVTKIVSSLNEEDRKKAVDSLVWEAICWQNDPVLGPYGEYQRVSDELMLYKRHCQQHYPQNNHYKMGQNLPNLSGFKGIGMNISDGGNINNNNSGGILNGSSVIGDSCPYNSYSMDNNRSIVLPQQLPLTGFNHQQYYFPTTGQYNPIDAKQMENTIWEDSR
ncbi:hypothetical protein LguiA_035119 [Lonicera macranthoides]